MRGGIDHPDRLVDPHYQSPIVLIELRIDDRRRFSFVLLWWRWQPWVRFGARERSAGTLEEVDPLAVHALGSLWWRGRW